MPTITTVDAAWDTGVTLDAAELRRVDSAIFAGDGSPNGVRGGVVYHGPDSLKVSVDGSDQVSVQPGAVVIPAATGLGVYRAALAAAPAAVALSQRNSTNPRIDLVVAHATGTNVTIKTIDGTPGASPAAPDLPAQCVEVGRINVPKVGGGAATVDHSWRTYATGLGGRLMVETAARLPGSGMHKGQEAVALDTGYTHVWTGTKWDIDSMMGEWVTYSGGVSAETGSLGNGNFTARYTITPGRVLQWSMVVNIITANSGGGAARVPLPFPARTSGSGHVGTGRIAIGTGFSLNATLHSDTVMSIYTYANSTPIASGHVLHLSGTCELA